MQSDRNFPLGADEPSTSPSARTSPEWLAAPHVSLVAQLAGTAPAAPPQTLEAAQCVLGAMLSPGPIGAVSEARAELEGADGRVRLHGLAPRRR